MNHPVETAVDAVAVGTLVGVVFGVLQQATILLTFLWALGRLFEMVTGVKVHETKPVQAALKRLKAWRSG